MSQVTVTELTNQVIITDPNGGSSKVVSVGVRGPAGVDAVDLVNIVQDNVYRHVANVEANVDIVSSNVDLVQSNLETLTSNSLIDIDTSNVQDGDVLVYVAANTRFEAGVIVDDEELDLSSIHDNVVGLEANVNIVSSNVESAETRAAANTAVVQANLDAYAATANALIAAGGGANDVQANLNSIESSLVTNINQVQSNVDATATLVDLVQSNLTTYIDVADARMDGQESNIVLALDGVDTTNDNLEIISQTLDEFATESNTKVDLVQANLSATTGFGNINLGVGDVQNEITVTSIEASDLHLSANVLSPESNIIIHSNIVPADNAVYSIGTPDKQIKDIHLSDGTIFLGINSSIGANTITLANFGVRDDGSIIIPGVNIIADLNAIDNVEIVASDIASNVELLARTGLSSDLLTTNKSNLVFAINEVFNKTLFSSVQSNTVITTDALEVTTSANVGGIEIVGTNVSAESGTLTFDGTNVLVQGNLIVEGDTSRVDSTITTLQDPILTLGGNTALTTNDGKDRGLEFRYYEDGQSKLGFLGWDSSANSFVILQDATNTDEEFVGTEAKLRVANLEASAISVDSLSANTLVGEMQGNIVTATANITSLEVQTINSLVFPNADGTSNQVLSTDGAGTLFFKDDEAGGGTGSELALGQAIDGSFNDGAYQNFSNTTIVTEAVDILNEVIENVRNNTFVKSVAFSASPTSGNSPLSVALSITTVGNPNQYEISWGDGTSNTTTSSTSANHVYDQPLGGFQTITVTAKNTGGSGEGSEASQTQTDVIDIATPAPEAQFTIADDTIDSGSTVSITNISQFSDSYEINFGDGSANVSLGTTGAGTPGNGALTHTYTNSGGDESYTITLTSASSTNGQEDTTTDAVFVYSTHTPTFTKSIDSGNNEESDNGLSVTFTNTTSSDPGNNSAFPDSIRYVWNWGDGTTDSVNAGTGAAGDTSQTIDHTFTLSDPETQQTFNITLDLYSGHSSSPFSSASQSITVFPDPRSDFLGAFATQSVGLNTSNVRKGYLFTDYNGNKRNVVSFLNQSINTDSYEWNFGDNTVVTLAEGDVGTPTGGNITHEYTTVRTYTVVLKANGEFSIGGTDDIDVKTAYIEIASNPTPPVGLSSKTLSMTSEDSGISPLLAANFDDNTGGASANAGDDLPRTVDQSGFVTTDTLSTFAATANTGTLSAMVNGVADGSKAFTAGNDAGTYTSLVITQDIDANSVDQNGNSVSGSSKIYPTGFYRVFKGSIQKSATALIDGVNSFQLSHSETGSTNTIEFVKESLTSTPIIDLSAANLTESTAGSKRYISGIPYYNTGGVLTLSGAKVYNWIDQTFRNTSTPFTIAPATNYESTSGDSISTQTRTYAQIDGASTFLSGSNPIKQTGINSSNKYTLGDISINVNGSARVVETLKFRMINVNGTGSYEEYSDKKLQVYSQSISGIDEQNIAVSDSLGSTFTDDAKRINIGTGTGDNPSFSGSTNYYTGAAWSGAQSKTTNDEAIVRFGTLKYYTVDHSSGYLPVGPDLSTSGRNWSNNQYIRLAFRRTGLANFVVRLTGRVRSFHIAAPGTQIDNFSGLNGWLDASSQYPGVGIPGSNGGNGEDGCAFSGGDRIIAGTSYNNQTFTLTLGAENASNAFGNQILVNIGLQSGDQITALSFEETS